eukprot:367829-Alexandrium_andersonii.AAC.1
MAACAPAEILSTYLFEGDAWAGAEAEVDPSAVDGALAAAADAAEEQALEEAAATALAGAEPDAVASADEGHGRPEPAAAAPTHQPAG